MKRIIKYIAAIIALALTEGVALSSAMGAPRCYYQLKIYHFKTRAQEARLDHYLKDAYLPALRRAHTREIGVFKTTEQDTADRRIYVLITYPHPGKIQKIEGAVMTDRQYLDDAKEYLDAPYNDVPYTRLETIVLEAFSTWKVPSTPQLTAKKTDRIYELRSYESPTEKYHLSKMKMFNYGGETALFARLNFNAVFYGDVLVGAHMPNLMYMTAFNNRDDREKHWNAFATSPEWKTLSALDEYKNNVSKAEITFLHPAEYSDF